MPEHTLFAYVDPGTGSYLLQLAMAGMLGAGYVGRRFWSQIKGLFVRQGGRPDADSR